MQPASLTALLRASREAGFHTSVETSGEAPPAAFNEAGPYVDLFLFDIKHCDEAVFREVCGGSLDLIFQNLKTLSGSGKVVARIPCIPGFNLEEECMKGIFGIALSMGITEAHLLPYHTLALDKYARLGLEYKWERKSLPREALEPFASLGRNAGLDVRIGG